jgi:2-polyprenyl-3-methyl-5-hydroxy-6-metoxy-1,4-benzoquinol methylase
MQRVLEPEWLDELPPSDARAERSRVDLRRINALMGNARHLALALDEPALRIADLGAGDGSVLLSVARRLQRPGVELTLVDQAAYPVPEEFTYLGWKAVGVRADVFAFLARPGPRFDAIVANLFLHHFEREPLRRLLELVAPRCALFVACEPRRTQPTLQASRLVGLLGCNDVTRHDAVVSVRAGFTGREISELWPREWGWRLSEKAAWPFSHLFVAQRDATL